MSSNIGMLSSDESHQLPQVIDNGDQGRWIKVRFPLLNGSTENMWVRVKDLADRLGLLDQDPLIRIDLKDKDLIHFEERAGFYYPVMSPTKTPKQTKAFYRETAKDACMRGD